MANKGYAYHVMAGITTVIWGTTMVSSKVLLNEGLSPAEIMFYRFLLGYVFLWILYPRTHRIRSLHDEALFAGMGIFGGSLYFLTENSALIYAQATDVSLICASVPLISAVLSHLALGERLSRGFRMGSAVAMAGVLLVILNGNFVLKMSPLGDILAFSAICCWAVYCLLVKKLRCSYNALFITRRLFLYGLLTLSPCFFFEPFHFEVEILQRTVVWSNLLFLGLIASSLCYVMWNSAIRELGIVKTNSYLYFSPVVTIVTAAIVLSEHLTVFILLGTALILSGLWLAGKK
ncbi:MAG: DMT family transporter [Tannerella sp.]|jgi:drug/metabolite transporter (DMT)-like permease|nr:DMT family transporter [Tannerella sp.]